MQEECRSLIGRLLIKCWVFDGLSDFDNNGKVNFPQNDREYKKFNASLNIPSPNSLTMKQSHCCHLFGPKRDKVALLESCFRVCVTLTCDLILSLACLLVFTLYLAS